MILLSLIKKLYGLVGLEQEVSELELLEKEADRVCSDTGKWLKYINKVIEEQVEDIQERAISLREEILKVK